MAEGLKHRKVPTQPAADSSPNKAVTTSAEHVRPVPKHGKPMELLRVTGFAVYFLGSCLFIHGTQILGLPLYVLNKDWFYAWMAMTKQHFGLLIATMTKWWSPTIVRVSGDKSVAGLIRRTAAGLVSLDFGERGVFIANHQLYTDWLYMWWAAYTNNPAMHGHIYIILKESLKWVPIVGPAMQLYGFVFMARKWASDQERMRYRLQKLKSRQSAPLPGQRGPAQLDPMWLLIFPEGTNLTANTRRESQAFSKKSGIPDMAYQVLPRVTGLQFCLQELGDSVEYVYDCTIGYGGIPEGGYGSSIFTLRTTYFQGLPPTSVNMHWRRFRIKDIPIDDHQKMYDWLLERWREKDALLEVFDKTGRFPGSEEAIGPAEEIGGATKATHVETEVRTSTPIEFLQMFTPVAAAVILGRVVGQIALRFLRR